MEHHDGPGGPGGERPLFQSRRRQQRERRSPVPLVIALALLILTSGAIWYLLRSGEPDRPVPVRTAADSGATAEPSEPLLDVPELDASDPVLRDVLARLSEHPEWARWLVSDDLVRRFVSAVVNVAQGDSPRSQVEFLEPEDPFQVAEGAEGLVVDARSYRRYDLFADAFASLDTQTSARFFRLLHPLFEEAHRELGLRDRTFDESFERALENLLAVEPPPETVAVVPYESVYEFADPTLEAMTPAQKHIVRLGPRNARRVQAKLRALAQALGLELGDPAAPGS